MSRVSRFFAADTSGSETESEPEEKVVSKKPIVTSRVFAGSDDEEDEKRVVRSVKTKKTEEVSDICKKVNNSLKIKDFDQATTDIDTLFRVIQKSKKLFSDDEYPKFFIKTIVDAEVLIKNIWDDKDGKQKLSKLNLKALTSLRQKIKKYNKEFETLINDYNLNPSKYELEAETAEPVYTSESSEEDFMDDTNKGFFVKPSEIGDKDSSSDSSYGTSDDGGKQQKDNQKPAWSIFIKKEGAVGTDKGGSSQKRDRKEKEVKSKKKTEEKSGNEDVPQHSQKQSKNELFPRGEEITLDSLVKALRELMKFRTKKNILFSFHELSRVAEELNLGDGIKIKILFQMIPYILDFSTLDKCLKPDLFKSVLSHFDQLLTLLSLNPTCSCSEDISEESERFVQPYVVRGNPTLLMKRINEELTKVLQNTDCYSSEYISKMKDAVILCDILKKLQKYVEKSSNIQSICDVYLLRLEHIYYKLDNNWLIALNNQLVNDVQDTGNELNNNENDNNNYDESSSDQETVKKLCEYLFKNGNERNKLRAMLCQIYHHAIHDRLYEAKDLFLMSKLQDTIQYSDIPCQILYNRAVVQLGLCYFRKGLIKEAYSSLKDFHVSGRTKELLAQGILTRTMDRTPKQELVERRQLLPFHMHINIELVECVYLMCALLLEGPYSAAIDAHNKKKFTCKSLTYIVRITEKQPIVGPPQTMREYIFATFKALKIGEWKKCLEHVSNIKCWKLFSHSSSVLKMLETKIKIECLRSYLFSYSLLILRANLTFLSQYFELEPQIVKGVITKMILNDGFPARFSEDDEHINFEKQDISDYLDSICTTLMEKVVTLQDNLERILEARSIIPQDKENTVIQFAQTLV